MKTIEIKTDFINLDQLLKWANLVSSGGEAKMVIKSGEVKVNGEVEERRGKKIYPEDIISISNQDYQILKEKTDVD